MREFIGIFARRTAAYSNVREDSRTKIPQKLAIFKFSFADPSKLNGIVQHTPTQIYKNDINDQVSAFPNISHK